MTSRARPGNRLPWGPALLPDTNQSLPAEAGRPVPVSGAQQTPASGAACKAESPLLPACPWLGSTGPAAPGTSPTVSHSHTPTRGHKSAQTTHE